MPRARISVSGLIQGIGFRPFVYRIAVKRGLKGYVRNLGDAGVRIEVSGPREAIEDFLRALKSEKPPIAEYTKLKVEWLEGEGGYEGFEIAESDEAGRSVEVSFIPPDIAICPECLRDMLNPEDRHYLYPFTCCALCGPRFTTIKEPPYDRERTTMDEFPMCPECLREFTDPTDRRFNAQTICCPRCGPRMTLYTPDGSIVECEDPIREAASLLAEGWIVAVKGIGGVHLAVKASEDEAVLRLRRRRRKPQKPFALMSLTVEDVRKFAEVSRLEEELLTSYQRPIVVLRKREPFPLSEMVSPGLHNVGVMLPYSGIHYLLLRYCGEPALVMTSANMPQEPMVTSNSEAFRKLRGVADYLLLHDRKIWARCDDSVVRVVDGAPTFLRRSRGYTPLPVEVPGRPEATVVAVGPELMSTASVLVSGRCHPTQHIGDVEGPDTLRFLGEAVRHMMKLLKVREVDAVACDMHPAFLSRKVAEELSEEFGAELVEVQHHHAHLASLMAEKGVPPGVKVVGIVCDGVGYGPDGTAWGGEVLVADYRRFERVGHLEPQPMPGGDACAVWYGRMLAGVLHGALPDGVLRSLLAERVEGFKRGLMEVEAVLSQLETGFNTAWTTSAGRVLDAASCLLKVCYRRTYEGEGAMKLEAAASKGRPGRVVLEAPVRRVGGVSVVETKPMMVQAYRALKSGARVEDVALAVHVALADSLARVAVEEAERRGVGVVGFSGGVAYNEVITSVVRRRVEEAGLRFIRHTVVPNGDGGVSVGQAVVAAYRLSAS